MVRTCDDPLTVSSVHKEGGEAYKVKVWQGALFGATQALICTFALRFVRLAVMLANPAPLVVALPAESEAVPRVMAKLTGTLANGMPRLSASTVSGTAMVAPCPTHCVGVTAARSSVVDVPTTVACCDCGGE